MNYNLHDIVGISTSDSLDPLLQKDIDFQIGYYKQDTGNSHFRHILSVKDYSDFHPDSVEHEIGYDVRANRYCLYNSSQKFAVVKKDDGIELFGDHSEIMLNYFLQMIFLKNKMTLIHAAGVISPSNTVTLFPAKGGIGKTGIIGELVHNYGYKLLGDDLVIISANGTCYSFLRDFVIKKYHFDTYQHLKDLKPDLDKKIRKKAVTMFLRSNLPFISILNALAKKNTFLGYIKSSVVSHEDQMSVSVDKIFPIEKIGISGKLKNIINLKRYSGSQIRRDPGTKKEFISRAVSTLFHEWSEYARTIFLMGSFDFTNLSEEISGQEMILTKASKNCKNINLMLPQQSTIQNIVEYLLNHKLV